MAGICVIGGGASGAEAAREAAGWAAEVTVIERLEMPEPAWRSWPELIRGCIRLDGPRGGASRLIVSEAASARPGLVRTCDGRGLEFEVVVFATGSRFLPVRFHGRERKGVLVLDRSAKYSELGVAAESASRIVVTGEGVRALQVADKLCAEGRGVEVLVTNWSMGEPSAPVRAAINRGAVEAGVAFRDGALDKAVGSDAVEAVVVRGSVLPCDLLAVLPHRIPNAPPSSARNGPHGGVLVDRFLATTSPGLFAAGGCAELAAGPDGAYPLDEVPLMSGRVAGANSAGRHIILDAIAPQTLTAFGLRWTRSGPCLGEMGGTSLPLRIVGRSWGPDSACTIAFEEATGRVLSIEAVTPVREPAEAVPRLSSRAIHLRSLAYGGSSDISLVSDTARLGLKAWSKS